MVKRKSMNKNTKTNQNSAVQSLRETFQESQKNNFKQKSCHVIRKPIF